MITDETKGCPMTPTNPLAEAVKRATLYTKENEESPYASFEEMAADLKTILSALQAKDAALKPFKAAIEKYERDCFFATKEASIVVPDETRVLLPGYEDEDFAASVAIGHFRAAAQALGDPTP